MQWIPIFLLCVLFSPSSGPLANVVQLIRQLGQTLRKLRFINIYDQTHYYIFVPYPKATALVSTHDDIFLLSSPKDFTHSYFWTIFPATRKPLHYSLHMHFRTDWIVSSTLYVHILIDSDLYTGELITLPCSCVPLRSAVNWRSHLQYFN